MRRVRLFLIVTIASIVSLMMILFAGYTVFTSPSASPSNWWGSMWSGMMDGGMINGYGNSNQTQSTTASYLGVIFIIVAVIAAVGIGGIIYFALFPEIRNDRVVGHPLADEGAGVSIGSQSSEVASSPYESVLRTLTADERKVIQVLSNHNGKYLQKYIRNEAELSRLQTHRIVARLTERGIVTLEKTGNTNTVILSNWLK